MGFGFVYEVFGLHQYIAASIGNAFAKIGEGDAFICSFNQLNAQKFLQLSDAGTERGLCDIEVACGLAKMAMIIERHKILKLAYRR